VPEKLALFLFFILKGIKWRKGVISSLEKVMLRAEDRGAPFGALEKEVLQEVIYLYHRFP
jgi:hypothetical protein